MRTQSGGSGEKPTSDVGEAVARLISETGKVNASSGGYRIKVEKPAVFPWKLFFELLLDHGFKLYVDRHAGMIYIEAEP